MLGLTIPNVNLLICGHFRRISDRMFRQLFLSASIIMVFSVQTKQKIELSMYYSEFYYQPIYHSVLNFPLEHLYNTTDYICFVLLSPIQLRS